MSEGALYRRLGATELALAANPYDARTVFERVLLLCVLGLYEDARRLLKQLQPFLAVSAGTARLAELTRGDRQVRRLSGCYVLDAAEPSAARLETVGVLATDIARSLGVDAPIVVLLLGGARLVSAHATRFVDGFGIVSIPSAEFEGGNAVPLLAHELTHLTLACGHPFLDEGLATYFQRRAAPGSAAPLPVESLPSLRALLQPEAGRVLREAGSGVQALYDYGAEVIRCLVRTHSTRELGAFLKDCVFSLSAGTLIRDFEARFETSLEDLERTIRKEASHGIASTA
jgi:hypothetical protein